MRRGIASLVASLYAIGQVAAATNSSNAADNSTLIQAYLESGYLDLGIASDAYEKAKAFVAPLNNKEKIAIVDASSFTGTNGSWSAYKNTDGVNGINFYFYVSAFTAANALTQTWDRDLYTAQFQALGDEYFSMGLNLIDGALLGPLGRVPEGGRQNEAFSPDPYLAGIAVAAGVTGQTNAGVVAGVRHFLLYEQETNRMGQGQTEAYSSNADDKTLHEVYMWPWSDAIQAGAMAVMCAMPRVNDTYSCSNNELLEGKLKTDLGFAGFVYPDESAQKTSYTDANAGLDYSPYSDGLWTYPILEAGILNGDLSQDRLDDMAIRSVLPYYFVGLDEADLPIQSTDYTSWRDIRANHSQLIREVGGASLALLKNNNANGGGLPLANPQALALFGAHAGAATSGPNYAFSVQGTGADVYQGHLATGGGSGQASLPYLITPQLALTLRAVEDGSMIFWISNNTFAQTEGTSGPGGALGLGQGTGSTPSYAAYAKDATVCLCFLNSWSGEGADRSSLYDADQDNMVIEVADNCNNTIVVVNVSGPRVLDAWVEHDNVTAVVYGGLLGQESGYAIADVLYGDVNPSGKLVHTIAKNESDYGASVCEEDDCAFDEGVYVDYRWFDAQGIEPRFPFGHGLSYTTFTYGDVAAQVTNETVLASRYPTGVLTLGGPADLYTEVVTVTTSLANAGSVAGAEVAQLYISFPDEAAQPTRVLRGFEKVSLDAAAASDVTFSVRRRDLSYWDVAAQQWAIAEGSYTFAVGASSRDIRGNATLAITIG